MRKPASHSAKKKKLRQNYQENVISDKSKHKKSNLSFTIN